MEKCPKCNSNKISVRFRYEKERVYWSEHNEIENIDLFTRNDTYYASDQIDKPCLQYKCDTCGYKIAENTKDKSNPCQHSNIVLVTEKYDSINEAYIYSGVGKKFVKCADCNEILPIHTVTKEEI